MKFVTEKGKNITIPDREISNLQKTLQLSKEEAIETWLCDNDLEENDEQRELDTKAKQVKIVHDAHAEVRKKRSTTRTVKISDEKQSLFSEIYQFLTTSHKNVEITKPNKLITIQIGEKIFKLDLIEQRPKKDK